MAHTTVPLSRRPTMFVLECQADNPHETSGGMMCTESSDRGVVDGMCRILSVWHMSICQQQAIVDDRVEYLYCFREYPLNIKRDENARLAAYMPAGSQANIY